MQKKSITDLTTACFLKRPAYFDLQVFDEQDIPHFENRSDYEKKAILDLKTILQDIQADRNRCPSRVENPLAVIDWINTHVVNLPNSLNNFAYNWLQRLHMCGKSGVFDQSLDERACQIEAQHRGIDQWHDLAFQRSVIYEFFNLKRGILKTDLDCFLNDLYTTFKSREIMEHPVYKEDLPKMLKSIYNLTLMFERTCIMCREKGTIDPIIHFYDHELPVILKERDNYLLHHPNLTKYQPLYDASPIEIFPIHPDWEYFNQGMNLLPENLKRKIPQSILLATEIQAATFKKQNEHYSSFSLRPLLKHFMAPCLLDDNKITQCVGGIALQDTGSGCLNTAMLITRVVEQEWIIPDACLNDVQKIVAWDKWQVVEYTNTVPFQPDRSPVKIDEKRPHGFKTYIENLKSLFRI